MDIFVIHPGVVSIIILFPVDKVLQLSLVLPHLDDGVDFVLLFFVLYHCSRVKAMPHALMSFNLPGVLESARRLWGAGGRIGDPGYLSSGDPGTSVVSLGGGGGGSSGKEGEEICDVNLSRRPRGTLLGYNAVEVRKGCGHPVSKVASGGRWVARYQLTCRESDKLVAGHLRDTHNVPGLPKL